MDSRQIGRRAERFAAEYLSARGYRVLGFNYVCREGEIDLIAQDSAFLVFVEVKCRKQRSLVGGLESVGVRKQARIKTAAGYYLAANPTQKQPRFDVIEIELRSGGAMRIKTHLENAF